MSPVPPEPASASATLTDQTERRVDTPAEADRVVDLLVAAFATDPFWGAGGWAFRDRPDAPVLRSAVFRAIVDGAVRYPWVRQIGAGAAAAVWIPPGGTELSAEQEVALEAMLRSALGPDAPRLLASFEQFDAARPPTEHYFLSLLGTHPQQAGHRHGQALLAANLRRLDAQEAPAYLDCADALVPVYERHGFRRTGSFAVPDGPTVNTMWRAPARRSG